MYNNEKSNDWVEVAATAAGVLIPILISTLGAARRNRGALLLEESGSQFEDNISSAASRIFRF